MERSTPAVRPKLRLRKPVSADPAPFTIETFKKLAVDSGAHIEITKGLTPNRSKLVFWNSADHGGCGSDGCRCSPGLWISAKQNGVLVVAHWGSDYQRGGAGLFTKRDYEFWTLLSERMERMIRVLKIASKAGGSS